MKFRVTKRSTWAAVALILMPLMLSSSAFPRNTALAKKHALDQFEKAEQMRAALYNTPQQDRSREDYIRVMEAYRHVYYTAPTSAKADDSVYAVGELLTEIGRRFDDEHMLKEAIGQYEFLRKEYPGSKHRVDALFAEAQIYREDLNDSDQAKATFEEFLRHYPRSHLADDAKKALAELAKGSDRDSASPRKEAAQTEHNNQAQLRTVSAKQKDESATESRQEKRSGLPFITGIRHWSTPDYTRVVIDLEAEVKYEAGRIPHPDRIFFDLHDTRVSSSLAGKSFDVQDGFLRKIRVAQFQPGISRVVLDVNDVSDYSAFLLPNPYRLIIDIHGKKDQERKSVAKNEAPPAPIEESKPTPAKETAAQDTRSSKTAEPKVAGKKTKSSGKQVAEKHISDLEQDLKKTENATKAEDTTITIAKETQPELKATQKPTSEPTFERVAPRDAKPGRRTKRRKVVEEPEILAHEARPTSEGERSLIRALGLKIGKIVIDPGHGGHDTGTIGPDGLLEKDLVLDVALRLGKLLETRMGADVVYTRKDDTFIPLETRTAIANQAQADLFISIHANSSRDASARGVETYYLNFTSSPDALEVAARENAVSEKSIHELQDLVKKITLKDKIDESREFAADVQRSLYSGLGSKIPSFRNRGVKKAPFIVLIGANMPSILAEISFLSNPTDERRLRTEQYRQKIAEYLYRGISRYVDGLSGLKVAHRVESAPVAKADRNESGR